jgi:ribosomal 30S subunit maturation factor RimM
MPTRQEARALVGATAYAQGGKKIGNVSTIYTDNATGEPEWLTVKTGLFGQQETFVPIGLAHARGPPLS